MAICIPSHITPSDVESVFRSGPAQRRGRTSSRPLHCPFTILVDTREQFPYSFSGLHADSDRSYRPLIVETQRETLYQGDYSIHCGEKSHATGIVIERKSKQDLFGTLSAGRDRFEDELHRLQECVIHPFIVVEAERSECINNPPEFSGLLPKTVFRSVMAWEMRFPSVHWWWCMSRNDAEKVTFRLLERYWRECQKGSLNSLPENNDTDLAAGRDSRVIIDESKTADDQQQRQDHPTKRKKP